MKGWIVPLFIGACVGLVLLLGNIGEIGAGNVEYKGNTRDASYDIHNDISSNKPETKDNIRSFDGSISRAQVFNSTSVSGATSNEQSDHVYVSNVSSVTIDVFQQALGMSVSWINMIVMLAIMGIVLSISMGILYKISNLMGLG